MVIWIIGLSGAGKTTLASEVVRLARTTHVNTVLVDGDSVREVFGGDIDYSMEGRRRNADRICRICRFLELQDINVVCSILSLFPDSRKWCRENLETYYEVFIDTPLEDVISRDSKGLYRKYTEGKIKNIAGLDLDFIKPCNSDFTITNNKGLDELISNAAVLANLIRGGIK